MLPCKLPIVQAPMAGVQDSALAIAVSQAGGLGSLPCAMLTTAALTRELEKLRDAGVDAYNLNFFCHTDPTPDAHTDTIWRSALSPYFAEWGVDPDSPSNAPSRTPFSDESLETIRSFQPKVVSFHFGLPKVEWLDEIKSWGGQVWSSATTLHEAKWLIEHGADALIAQGVEAGGHRGMFLTQDLATQIETRDLLALIKGSCDIPVIAAGGISHPDQVASLLKAGAAATQVGTAYLCCHEAKTSALHRKLLLSPEAEHTQLTNLLSGRPARGMVNRLMRELGPISEIAPEFPLAGAALTKLRATAEKAGSTDFSPLWCGTDASGCREQSAADQTRWLAGG